MRIVAAFMVLLLLGCAVEGTTASTAVAGAQACSADPEHWVATSGGCLAMSAFGPARGSTLIVVLHGDLSGGAPATYHQALARRAAEVVPGAAVVALVRPGYSDAEGRTSAGDLSGRQDHYTAANVTLVATAIEALKARTGARRVVAIGHSGGAATTADILALHPRTLDAAMLLACPCDITTWRAGRRPWLRSVSPLSVVDRVPAGTVVAAYTGTADPNTPASVVVPYIDRLLRNGARASFTPVDGATHDGVVGAVWTTDFARRLTTAARS